MSADTPIASYRKVVRGSDRNFGLVFAVAFAVIGLWPLVKGQPLRLWALGVAAAFLLAALLLPRLLAPLNIVWFRFGLLLHRVVNPLVMALIYAVAVVPMGLAMRALGKDLLRLKREPEAESYWIMREPPGPAAGSMRQQF